MTSNASITDKAQFLHPHEAIYLDAAGVLRLNGKPWPDAAADLNARIAAHLWRVERFLAASKRGVR